MRGLRYLATFLLAIFKFCRSQLGFYHVMVNETKDQSSREYDTIALKDVPYNCWRCKQNEEKNR